MPDSPRLLDRRAAALCLLLAPLLEVVEAAFSPLRDTTTAADISAIAAHQQRFTLSVAAGLVATMLYVPAFLGAGSLGADRSRRLATAATSLLVLAMLGFSGVRMGQAFELSAVRQHMAPDVAAKLMDGAATTVPGAALMAVFLLGSTLGLWLLSAALWRSQVVPRPAVLAVAAFPLIDLGLKGHLATIAAHVVLFAGLAVIATRLLKAERAGHAGTTATESTSAVPAGHLDAPAH